MRDVTSGRYVTKKKLKRLSALPWLVYDTISVQDVDIIGYIR